MSSFKDSPGSDIAIQLENIEFRYSAEAPIILQIDKIQVNKAEKIFLFGPSGCGKTTLLETLAGILVPQKGSVKLLGENFVTKTAYERDTFRANHLGYIFQSFNLIPYLSVVENILLPLSFSLTRKKRLGDAMVASAQVQKLMEKLGIEQFQNKKVTELSVGQQQRVAVARALLGSPEIILADEPTSSLDYDHREMFIKLLFEICSENQTTVLFVSHDRTLEKLFDRSLSLQQINKAIKA